MLVPLVVALTLASAGPAAPSKKGGSEHWLRKAIRAGRLRATRGPSGYLLRRRDVERLDRSARRLRRRVEADDDRVDVDTSES